MSGSGAAARVARSCSIKFAGSASGRLKGGRHIRNPKDTTMSNLLLAILGKLNIEVDHFGDSTGPMAI